MDALELPSICAVTSPQIAIETLRLMHDPGYFGFGTKPASAQVNDQISILIGSDYYWQVTSDILQITQPKTPSKNSSA